jgi:uncharacterized protein YndB with AHSA1/START domain
MGQAEPVARAARRRRASKEMNTMTAMTMHIEAPVETVFGYFKDPMALADLTTLDIEYDEVKETKEGTGTYFSWHSKIAGIPFEGFEVYTDVVPNQHITEKSSRAVMGTWDYSFEPEGTGTKVTMEHRQRSLWSLPPLTYAVDYLVPRMSQSFMDFVRTELEREVTLPSQRKPARSSGRKPVTSH